MAHSWGSQNQVGPQLSLVPESFSTSIVLRADFPVGEQALCRLLSSVAFPIGPFA
jgi:hypothetical protein